MIEIEIINAILPSVSYFRENNKASQAVTTYCNLKIHGKDIGRTSVSPRTFEPVWNEKFVKDYHDINLRERVYNRPFYLEYFEVEIFECSPTSPEKSIKVYEARVPLSNIGLFKSYKLTRCNLSSNDPKIDIEIEENCRIFVRINQLESDIFEHITSFNFTELVQILPPKSLLYRHLYMDFEWSPWSYTYRYGLPGPLGGELVVDKYDYVELLTPVISNAFNDRFVVTCHGSIFITDLRVIFLPSELSFPHQQPLNLSSEVITIAPGLLEEEYTEMQLLCMHRYTVQFPLSAIVTCRSSPVSSGVTPSLSLAFDTIDGSSVEFIIKKPGASSLNGTSAAPFSHSHSYVLFSPPSSHSENKRHSRPRSFRSFRRGHRYPLLSTVNANVTNALQLLSANRQSTGSSGSSNGKKHQPPRSNAVEFDKLLDNYKKQMLTKLASNPYFGIGLDSQEVDLAVWAARVVDYVHYEIKLDAVWLRWTKYMKVTLQCFEAANSGILGGEKDSKGWLKKAKQTFDIDFDYQRHYIQDFNWRFSSLNESYSLCGTYPSTLVFPGTLSDEDLVAAASQRSINRLPSLIWLHPITKAALCRAAQPLAGMSGLLSTEFDKKLLLAIRNSSPNGLPLRIVDARPKLNANANAVQGKGFENISFLGGPSVASLTFLDIENIHVMRSSLQRVKEGLTFTTNSNSSGNNSLSASSANTSGSLLADQSTSIGSNNLQDYFAPSSSTATNTIANSSSGNNNFDNSSNAIASSKWTQHVASVLKGSLSVAESLMLGYPVLVHCSDGWDRTSQVTALSQLLLDPYYRTIEGFLVLAQREWCAFGHKFEDRSGRSNFPKETSPIFLQFLDCVHQVLIQFPNHFEFTSYFLVLLMQCLHSGMFITLRCNCERDRAKLIHNVALYEDLTLDDMEFSSLTFYISLLLKGVKQAAMLKNPHFIPGKAFEKQVNYLRPKCGYHDMVVWLEGLFGLNANLLDMTTGNFPVSSTGESVSTMYNMFSRYINYVDNHVACLPSYVQEKLELIQHTVSPYTASLVASFRNKDRQTFAYVHATEDFQLGQSVLLRKWKRYWSRCSGTEGGGEIEWTDWEWRNLQDTCARRIQWWYRAFKQTQRALIDWGYCSRSDFERCQTDPENDASAEAAVPSPKLAVYYILYHFHASYLHQKLHHRQEVALCHASFVGSIIDEIIFDAIERGRRSDFFMMRKAALSLSSGDYSPVTAERGGLQRTASSDGTTPSGKLNLSARRFFKTFGTNGGTAMASVSEADEASAVLLEEPELVPRTDEVYFDYDSAFADGTPNNSNSTANGNSKVEQKRPVLSQFSRMFQW